MNPKTNRFGWIKRRARRIQQFYRVPRHTAVRNAWIDWLCFVGATA